MLINGFCSRWHFSVFGPALKAHLHFISFDNYHTNLSFFQVHFGLVSQNITGNLLKYSVLDRWNTTRIFSILAAKVQFCWKTKTIFNFLLDQHLRNVKIWSKMSKSRINLNTIAGDQRSTAKLFCTNNQEWPWFGLVGRAKSPGLVCLDEAKICCSVDF